MSSILENLKNAMVGGPLGPPELAQSTVNHSDESLQTYLSFTPITVSVPNLCLYLEQSNRASAL